MCTIIIQYTLQYTKKRHLAEDRQNTCNLMSSCFCYFDWEHTMLYSLKPEHVAAICFTLFYKFLFLCFCHKLLRNGSNVGFWWRLVKVIKDRKFLHLLTYHHFFLYNNITLITIIFTMHTCIHIMMKNIVVHQCLTVHSPTWYMQINYM